MNEKKRAAVAMSGGVDSSATAALLVEQGYDVIGLTMQLWDHGHSCAPSPNSRTCCATEDVQDARHVAETLGIPFYVINLQEAFRQAVVEDFITTYAHGQTPNPCVRCNQILKFEILLDRARQLGAEFLATGHYARCTVDPVGHAPQLWRGADRAKDQSYFLFATTREQLQHIRFPLGDISKARTRALAARAGLHLADKRESQDVCFVPDGDYAAFFAQHAPHAITPGPIVDRDGKILGQHHGLARYTVGQRRGLGVAAPHPLYVIALDADNNRLIVGPNEALMRDELVCAQVNWIIDAPSAPFSCQARIRYAAEPQPATVTPLPDGGAQVAFAQSQRAVTPGQACVFYQEDQVLGGGWIQ
ncbi:tRNA 2-thiouridine(34) synthase MnmA [Magnetofaba australis]|uniref:tRNA-specific 2-thiouridylase MnmA n=1 Tax=Magnetofaba australis IT-1 TaxID=1434232 RepID=A0A1Y2K5Q7_9PROT|nr:tRNA 2-thiouridine(34) synthase MnmA [Magnetofaba australis]OSM04959.1 putative tRNA (5-methyl aminomethyl-2-thiouridylate)-methyltransferase [Magnetofaba australis IT-1]